MEWIGSACGTFSSIVTGVIGAACNYFAPHIVPVL